MLMFNLKRMVFEKTRGTASMLTNDTPPLPLIQ